MSEPMKPIVEGLGGLFADLERRTREVLDLTARVRQALDGPEKDHVLSASYREDTLVVVMDSAAWSSRVHYMQQALLEKVRSEGETQVTKVRVRVGARSG